MNFASRPLPLKNVKGNCYLNSALQGISSCDIFVKELGQLQEKYKELPKLDILNQLIVQLNGKSKKKRNFEISSNPIFKEWNKPGQQDSFELLSYMINQVYEEIRNHLIEKETLEKDNIENWLKEVLPLRLILEYKMECQECEKDIEIPMHSELALHLCFKEDKNNYNIENMMKDYFEKDEVVNLKCVDCSKENIIKTVKLIEPIPKTICIHLQRSKQRLSSLIKSKNKVEIDETLTLCSKYFDLQSNDNSDSQSLIYIMKSVIVYSGNAHSGHYICYKNVNSLWFQTNDSCIKDTTWNDVKSSQPYILFYELLE